MRSDKGKEWEEEKRRRREANDDFFSELENDYIKGKSGRSMDDTGPVYGDDGWIDDEAYDREELSGRRAKKKKKLFGLFGGKDEDSYYDEQEPRRSGRAGARAMAHPAFAKFTKVWSVLYLALFAIFIFMLLIADILPLFMTLIIIGILGVISLLIFPMLYFKNVIRQRKIIATVAATVLMAIYVYGALGLGTLAGFFSAITDRSDETAAFYVVVAKSSPHKSVRDIKGHTVGTYISEEPIYMAARKKLHKKAGVTYETSPSVEAMGDSTMVGGFDSTLMSRSHYRTIAKKKKGFKQGTRVIYKFNIKLSDASLAKRVNVTRKPFNILISGLDVSGPIDVTSRSDVNMVMTVNPKTQKIVLTSIPRDTVIKMVDKNGANDKLTHTGIYGIGCTMSAVEDLLGVDMNYYVKVNYSTVQEFVDAIGGVDVKSDYEFDTHGMKAKYHYKKGMNHLDGKHALAFARERKSFPDGDIQRNRNQAKVMQAMLKKGSSSKTILFNYANILNSCKDYMQLNMTDGEVKRLIRMQIAKGYKWKIRRQSLTGQPGLMPCYSTGAVNVSVVQTDPASLAKCQKTINRIMGRK